jgi:hypothetical protein
MADQTPTVYVDPHSQPPVVNGKPKEIADGVFVVPDGRVPLVLNVGVIVGTRATLVIAWAWDRTAAHGSTTWPES